VDHTWLPVGRGCGVVASRISDARPTVAKAATPDARDEPIRAAEPRQSSPSARASRAASSKPAAVGRSGAATRRGITSLEVSGRVQRLAWGAKLLDWAFHTAAATGSGLGCEGRTIATAKPVCGRQHQRPVWGTNRLLAAEFKPPWRGGGPIQSGGGFVEGGCRPRARRRRRCRVVGSRRSGGRAGTAWSQHPHPVGVAPSTTRPAPPPRGASGDVGAADPRGSHRHCRAGSA
jgi:hypothetical protein